MSIVSTVAKGAVKVGKAAAKSPIARELATAGIIAGVVGLADSTKLSEDQKKELEAKKAAKTAAKKAAKEAKRKYKEERKSFKEQQRKTREVEAALFKLQQNGVTITPEMLSGGATNQQPTIKADFQDQDLVEISPEEIEHDIKVFNEQFEKAVTANSTESSNVIDTDELWEEVMGV
jgi:hypothetical protein